MTYDELKTKSLLDLRNDLKDLKKESFFLRVKSKAGSLKDSSKIKQNRRSLARVLTRIVELKRS